MSAALINRSLTTVKTELEFLRDSEVITDGLYERIIASIPAKYDKNASAWDVDRLGAATSGDGLAAGMSKVSLGDSDAASAPKTLQNQPETLHTAAASPPRPPAKVDAKPLGYCRSLYDYRPQEADDLTMSKDDKIAVLEHLSEDWWKGYRQGESPANAGVFPSNYVTVISQQEFDLQRGAAPVPEKVGEIHLNKAESEDYPAPPLYSNPNQNMHQGGPDYGPSSYNGYQNQYPPNQFSPQPQMQPLQQQPSYGGYAQFPPPSTNYYPPQPQQPQQYQQPEQQQGGSSHPHLKKFGSKFGNAAIFGAGATLGGDLVNSIF